jgi:hypothetical protein
MPPIRLVTWFNVATTGPLANNYQRSVWMVGGGVEGYGSLEQREISLGERRWEARNTVGRYWNRKGRKVVLSVIKFSSPILWI